MRRVNQIINKIQFVINKILLNIIYLIGVGISSVIAKFAGKNFLNVVAKKSLWEKTSGSKDLDAMY